MPFIQKITHAKRLEKNILKGEKRALKVCSKYFMKASHGSACLESQLCKKPEVGGLLPEAGHRQKS
jgi:hypothetical protein